MTTLKTALVFLLLLPAPAPDEGQWLPGQFRDWDWDALRERGMELTRDEFWHPDRGGVLSAAVQINGCSASFVSPEGLVVTNHHCGFGAIQRNSTVENNYVEKGFVAEDRAAELPCPGMVVAVIHRIEDVTAPIHEAQAGARNDLERYQLVADARRKLIAEAQRRNPGTVCSIASFFDGREYRMYHRTQIRDVRLVYAPPRSIGEFGGEEDNWMWPRHTGDFCFFRAYVGPDGKPAPHAPENVPYEPPHHLRVSATGAREGDVALILGYPGRTERYLTSALVRAREEHTYPVRLRLTTAVIDVLERVAAADPERALGLSTRIKSLANVQKNARGMIAGLARNRVVESKRREEEAFARWVAADPARRKRFGTVLEDVLALERGEAATAAKDTVLVALWNNVPLVTNLMQAAYAAVERELPEDQRDSRYGPRMQGVLRRNLAGDRIQRDLESIQIPILAAAFDEALRLPEAQRIPVVDELAGDMSGAEAVEAAVRTSDMTDGGPRAALFDRGIDAMRESDDPLVRLACGMADELRALRMRNRNRAGARLVTGRLWIEAQEAWRGASFYPDANGTLRISLATVMGYEPRDGIYHVPFTTLSGVLEKETGQDPFASPPALLAAAESRRESRFFDHRLGDVPVCFLTDGDTTGGNSGSPVINGRGELIGLNFDRVFENVAGDYVWTAERSRNISVDVRYVLWNLESVIPAPHLLRELGVADERR